MSNIMKMIHYLQWGIGLFFCLMVSFRLHATAHNDAANRTRLKWLLAILFFLTVGEALTNPYL